jgi:hypothetical protein
MSHDQNAEQNHKVTVVNIFRKLCQSSPTVFVSNKSVRGECLLSLNNLLSLCLLPKNIKIIVYKTVIVPVILYMCETWSLTLRKEHILRVFENKVLR